MACVRRSTRACCSLPQYGTFLFLVGHFSPCGTKNDLQLVDHFRMTLRGARSRFSVLGSRFSVLRFWKGTSCTSILVHFHMPARASRSSQRAALSRRGS